MTGVAADGEGLRVERLSKHFRGLAAVDDVSFAVAPGAIHGLIGPNGAGKTTLFNLISGLAPPTSGRILFGAVDLTARPAHARAGLGVTRTFQNLRLFTEMTALENVVTGLHPTLTASLPAILLRRPRVRAEEAAAKTRALECLAAVGLSDAADRPAGDLPYGAQRRLEVARAIASRPKLLLLDEPAAGLNPSESLDLAAVLRGVRAAGTTLLLVEHDMRFVMTLCDQLTILSFGKKIAEGAPERVRTDPVVIEAYLGAKVAQRLARTGS